MSEINHLQLEKVLNELLNSQTIQDYAPNGLQVEGKKNIRKIVTGVTACQALLDYAVAQQADAVIVHHGYFWKNESPLLRGMKGQRIKTLMQHNINLYAYHLPLDLHPELGNNAQLAQRLSIVDLEPLEDRSLSIPVYGRLTTPILASELQQKLTQLLHRSPLHCGDPQQLISTVAICTGGGQDYIDLAAEKNIDAFISGEISERTTHSAREQNIHYFSAGHHATERFGIQALGKWLKQQYQLDVEYKEIDNPA